MIPNKVWVPFLLGLQHISTSQGKIQAWENKGKRRSKCVIDLAVLSAKETIQRPFLSPKSYLKRILTLLPAFNFLFIFIQFLQPCTISQVFYPFYSWSHTHSPCLQGHLPYSPASPAWYPLVMTHWHTHPHSLQLRAPETHTQDPWSDAFKVDGT